MYFENVRFRIKKKILIQFVYYTDLYNFTLFKFMKPALAGKSCLASIKRNVCYMILF